MLDFTYRELGNMIAGMTDEQKDCDVTVYNIENDECWVARDLLYSSENLCGQLDDDHPIIAFVE